MATIDESMAENEADAAYKPGSYRHAFEIAGKNAHIIGLNERIKQLRIEADKWKNCAQELRGEFVPNTRDHPAIKAYNSCCEIYDPTNVYYEP